LTGWTDPAWLEHLGEITAETLVIGGGTQSPVPQDWVTELAGKIPGARMETIEAGHLIHDVDPEAFTRTVRGSLDPSDEANHRAKRSGMAAAQAEVVHRGVGYDIEVDTGHAESMDCARAIAACVV
jgi:hypothetical protein